MAAVIAKPYQSRQCCGAQAEALGQPGVLKGASLVFSAPTSAGKSAVAEVLALRRLCDRRTADRIVLLVLPFVSLCQEKVAHLEKLLQPLDKCGACLLPAHACAATLLPPQSHMR